jgi:hypothetical protein
MHGNPTIVRQYQMQDYPMTLADYAHLARTAVRQLQSLRVQETCCATEVLVSFTAANMPPRPQ